MQKLFRRTVGALVCVLLAGAFASLAPSSALAGDVSYCNVLVAPKSACPYYSPSALRSDNLAEFRGIQTRSVCEKVNVNGTLVERICANNWAYGTYAWYFAANGQTSEAWVGNDSDWTHTINGGTYVWDSAARSSSATSPGAAPPASPAGPTVSPTSLPREVRSGLGALRSAPSTGKVAALTRVNDKVALRTTAKRLCLSASQAGGEITCQRYDKAITGDLLAAAICARNLPATDVAIYGVVPDGVTAVRVTSADGALLGEAAVAANTFQAQLPKTLAASAEQLEWVGQKRTVSLDGIVPDGDLSC